MRTTALALLALGGLLLAGQAPAAAQTQGCAALMPGVVFDEPIPLGPAVLRGSGLTPGLAGRVADDLRIPAETIAEELGGLEGVEVCVFADELPLDAQALGWPEGQRLRAVSFGPERALVLSAWQVGLLKDAGILGLAHQAEWGVSDGTYPDPFGGAVAQWYAARFDDRLARDHNVMRYANLIRAIPESIPWAGDDIPSQLLWNPEFQLSAIGDFVDFAVATEGIDVLSNPDPAGLAALQESWQRALLVEATGSETGTRGWILGVAIVGSALAIGTALAVGRVVQARRQRRRRPRTTIAVSEEPAGVGPPRDRNGRL